MLIRQQNSFLVVHMEPITSAPVRITSTHRAGPAHGKKELIALSRAGVRGFAVAGQRRWKGT